MPAIDRGIERARAEIDAIVNNPEAPTFENTIVAYEKNGEDLDRVTSIFFNLLEADANDEMMALSMEASQKLSDYGTDIILNPGLWQRIKTVNDFYANNKEAYDALTPRTACCSRPCTTASPTTARSCPKPTRSGSRN